MKSESKVIFSDIAKNIILAGILFFIPLMFSPGLYNSFRLPKNILFVFLSLAALFFSIMYFCEKKEIDWRRYKAAITISGVLLIIQLLVWISSASRQTSFWGDYMRAEGLIVWLFLIVFFLLLIFNSWDASKYRAYMLIVVISGFLVAAYGVLQRYELIPNIWAADVSERIISTMGNPLNLSAYLILVFPFIYYVFFHYQQLAIRIFAAVCFLTAAAALYFSSSRSSWIAFLFANAILVAFLFFKKNKKIFISLIVIIILGATTFGYVGIKYYDSFKQPVLHRLFSAFDPNDLSNEQRLLYWQGSFEAFKERPLFGWGHDFLQYAFDKNYPPKLSDLPETHIDRAHNWHLDMLVMQGAAGWLAMISVLIFGLYKAIKLLSAEEKRKQHIGLIHIYLMAACLLQFFFMFALIEPYLLVVFSLALVMVESYSTSDRPHVIKSRVLEKLKKNSNLYLIIGIVFSVFVFFALLRPVIANRDIWSALIRQKDIFDHFQKAAQIMPSEFYRQQFGSVYLKMASEGRVTNDIEKRVGNAKKCIEIFTPLVKDYPYHYTNYSLLAECHDLDNNYEIVDATFQKAIDNFPTRHDIYWKWAGFLHVRGDDDRAIEIYQKAIAIDPEIAVSYYKLALFYEQIQDKNKEEENLKIAYEKGIIPQVVGQIAYKKYFDGFSDMTMNASSAPVATNDIN
ncbi:MAG: O-antigen ligase family protein [Patescibacteria group bacterium]